MGHKYDRSFQEYVKPQNPNYKKYLIHVNNLYANNLLNKVKDKV